MLSHEDILQSLADSRPVRLFLPIIGTTERYRTSCLLQKTTAPKFELLFKMGELPTESIDRHKSCLIIVDMGGPTVSIEANILDILNEQTLSMQVIKSISHEQLREFFRVDATTEVISSCFVPEFFDREGKAWRIKGRTIDISGSGILATFPEKPPMDDKVRLEIVLPSANNDVVSILAHPVRTQQMDENNYEVAYHFDDISSEDRDKIIGCCLIIQRRHLRLKVQVKDSTGNIADIG